MEQGQTQRRVSGVMCVGGVSWFGEPGIVTVMCDCSENCCIVLVACCAICTVSYVVITS